MPPPARNRPADQDEPRRRLNLFAPVLLVVSGAVAIFIDFPPGDSWTHGWTVDQWLQGNWVLNDWSSAVALPQQVLGWIVHIGADSVQWWRLSVLTAIVTVAGCLLAAELPGKLFPESPQLKHWTPLFVILLIAPPFTLKIGAGFMTDGYYLILLTASLWILIDLVSNPTRHTDSQWFLKWAGFGVLAVLASLQRSHGFFLLIIPGVWVFLAKALDRDRSRRAGWSTPRTLHAIIVCAFGLVVGFVVLALPGLSPARSSEVTLELAAFWAGYIKPFLPLAHNRIHLIFGILHHLGLALLPVALIARLQRTTIERKGGKQRLSWWYVLGGVVFILVTAGLWAANGDLFPYLGNSLTSEGFGPRSVTIALTAGHEYPEPMRIALTLLGTGGGLILIWILSRTARLTNVDWRTPSTLIGLIGIAHLGIVLLNPYFFDRYLLPLLPFCLCWLAPLLKDVPAKARLGGWVIVLMFLGWSITGTYESLDWSKSKWDLAAEARAGGIPSEWIVGGYEVDGFYNYSNETYPGRECEANPMLKWDWISRLGLPNVPYYVIFEEGAQVEGTSWAGYAQTEMYNGRMRVWAAPRSSDE